MARMTFRERTSLVRLNETVESIRFNGTEQATLVATDEGHEIRSPGRGTSEMLGFDEGDAGRMDMAVQYLIRLDRDERQMQWLHNKMLDMIQNYLWRRDPDYAHHDLTKTAELLDCYAIAMRAHAAGDPVAAEVALSKAQELCLAYGESFAALQDGAILVSTTPGPWCRRPQLRQSITMSETLQRTLLPDDCALITSKLDDGNFHMAFRQVRDGIPLTLNEYTYEPDAWKKAGLKLDELIEKLRKHDNWKDMGKAWVKWIDENRPIMPREM